MAPDPEEQMTTTDHIPTDPHPRGTAGPVPATTMRAVLQHAYGDDGVWRVGDAPVPKIAEDEVLVDVAAAGLDRGTWHIMTGTPHIARLVFGLRRPKNPVPGLDLAGTVVAVGSGVTRFTVGDTVFGIGRGSFAEYAAARQDKLAHVPTGISMEQAAVIAVSGLTAIQAADAAGITAGRRVLITGASGGVGSYAVQLAAALGAEVTGVCRTAKLDGVRALGASHVLDRTTEDFADGSTLYDIVIDIAGSSSVSRLRRALAPKGTLVIVGGEGGRNVTGIDRQLRAVLLSPFVGHHLKMLVSKEHFAGLERLAALIEAGSLIPHVDRAFPLEQAEEAMRHLVGGTALGKIAITVER